MKFLHIDNFDQKNIILKVLKYVLPLTFIYKVWFLAELQYNNYGLNLGAFTGRVFIYAVSGVVAYALALLAVSFSFGILYKSKYSPCDENCTCRINKPTYTAVAYFTICISNILCGTLNFIAYAQPISIAFILLLMPTILSFFAICGIVALLSLECKKGEFKQLLTSMALPSIIFLLFLR